MRRVIKALQVPSADINYSGTELLDCHIWVPLGMSAPIYTHTTYYADLRVTTSLGSANFQYSILTINQI